jgi:hypothetical protein
MRPNAHARLYADSSAYRFWLWIHAREIFGVVTALRCAGELHFFVRACRGRMGSETC